jgi:hypothetical protein
MKFEQMPGASSEPEELKNKNLESALIEGGKEAKPETSKRLLAALEPTRLNFSKIELIGADHLAEIPPDAKVVIAVDHLNNLSIPAAALMLGRRLPVQISNQSTQFSFRENPGGHIGVAVGGKDNFKGIDYNAETNEPKPFNPENFDDMLEPLGEGYAMIVAAHNPVNTNKLPEKAGYGAAYLAGISDAYILPVSVNVKSEVHVMEGKAGLLKNIKGTIDMVRNRPEVEVTIGKPHKIAEEADIQKFHKLFMKRKETGRLSADELEEFKHLRISLNAASDEIMEDLAGMLPSEKRGEWLKEEAKEEAK